MNAIGSPSQQPSPHVCLRCGHIAGNLDLDVLLLIMDLLADERPSLAACSLVCYSWYQSSRPALFRVIYLENPPESLTSEIEVFLRRLQSFDMHKSHKVSGRLRVLKIPDYGSRLQIDFRPFVQEIHFLGSSPWNDRYMLSRYPRKEWENILHCRAHHILKIIRRLPHLRVADFRNPSSFFRPQPGSGTMRFLFWAIAQHVEELRLENKWSLAEFERDTVPLDLDKALEYPTPPHPVTSCKLRTLVTDNFDISGLSQLWDWLLDSGPNLPVITSLTVPAIVLESASFRGILPSLGRHLKHLRFDLTTPAIRPGQFVPFDELTELSSCVNLCSFELGCKRCNVCAPPALFDFAQRLIGVLPPKPKENVTIELGSTKILSWKSPSTLGYVASPTDWARWIYDARTHMPVDAWVAAHDDLPRLTFRVNSVYVETALRSIFPITEQAGKLRVEVV